MALPRPGELAGRNTDPRFYSALNILPNPDPILRKAGKDAEVFDAIQSDAHVMGELRLIRADLTRFKHNLKPGGKTRKDKRAHELCQTFLDRAPAPMTRWPDVIWNTGTAPFRGLSVHEIVWERQGDLLMPEKLMDRPTRRFAFDPDGALRLLTRDAPLYGVPAEDAYFMVNRHMPSYDNPYGVALFSSCFWPYTFKHAGFRWFVKFCERFGIPFPVGTYPMGATDDQVRTLEEALAELLEAGYAAIEDGGDIDIKEATGASGGGKLAQQQLVDACNAEMSKALSSQTLSSEQTGATGARAAAETHRGRSIDVNECDRDGIAYAFDHLWRLITLFNVGPDAAPPTSEFMNEEAASKDRAEVYKIWESMGGKGSRKSAAEDLGIQLADDNDEADQFAPPAPAPVDRNTDPAGLQSAQFARMEDVAPDQDAIDEAEFSGDLQGIATELLKPLFARVKDGVSPEELLADLANLYPDLKDQALQDLTARVLFVGEVWGRLSAQDNPDA